MRQEAPEGATNTWWAYTVVLQTETPQVDWFKFRELFLANGGDDVYACWKLTYTEDFFVDEVSQYEGVWQQFGRQTQPGLCPTAGLSLSLSLPLCLCPSLSLCLSLQQCGCVCVCVCVCVVCVRQSICSRGSSNSKRTTGMSMRPRHRQLSSAGRSSSGLQALRAECNHSNGKRSCDQSGREKESARERESKCGRSSRSLGGY